MEADSKGDETCGLAINYLRLIDGNINDFSHCRNDSYVLNTNLALIINDNLLLGRGHEIAHGRCLRAQALH